MHLFVDPNSSIEDGATSLEHPIVVDKCWKGYSNHPYIWILAGPMTAALLVSNFFQKESVDFQVVFVCYEIFESFKFCENVCID
jgi:hypothetical protein